jgi:hypothetical protein
MTQTSFSEFQHVMLTLAYRRFLRPNQDETMVV